MVRFPGRLGTRTTPPELEDAVRAPRIGPPEAIEGVVDTYRIPSNGGDSASAQIFIVEREGLGKYLVRLPTLDGEEQSALALLKANMLNSIPVGRAEPGEILEEYLWKTADAAGLRQLVEEQHDKLLYFLLRDFSGFWEIDPLMNDDAIEEISLTRFDRPVRVLHRNFSEYAFMETDVVYPTEARLQGFIRRLAQFGGTTVSLAQPSLEVTLHGRSDRRVTATLGDEISRPGSTFAIRKQKEKPLTLTQLAAPETAKWHREPPGEAPDINLTYEEVHSHKTLSVLMAAYFWLLLERTTNVLIAGETNSGKTTLMNSILALTNPKSKVVTAEDVLEINLPDHLHWQRLKTRSRRSGFSPTSAGYEYDLSDLLKLALRFSPTILSLGEMRGEESATVAAAITLGFSTMTTIHAENAERCVQRLTTAPMKFAEGHVRDITAIATMRKTVLPDGRVVRRVVSVDEVRPVGASGHELRNVFWYDHAADAFGPTTPAEVVDRSHRLNEIAKSFGWTPAKIQYSLSVRAAYLAKCIAESGFNQEALMGMVKEFSVNEFKAEVGRD